MGQATSNIDKANIEQKPTELFFEISKDDINTIKRKSIEMDYFDPILIIYKLRFDKRFCDKINIEKTEKILEFYKNSGSYEIYKKTHCLCINDLDLCIINKNSDKLKQIYDGCNYEKTNYCSFISFKPDLNIHTMWQRFKIK